MSNNVKLNERSLKGAATRVGIPWKIYKEKREQGLFHCCYCREWLPRNAFVPNKGRACGVSTSCAPCLKDWQENTIGGRYSTYKSKAKRRGISFLLSKNEFATLWQQDCYYCGAQVHSIGIDRIKNDVGYVLSNCVPCCSICNMMKHSHHQDEWLKHVAAIFQRHSRQAKHISLSGNGYWKR